MPETPVFLTLDHVLRLHRRQVEQHGGSDGIRDIQLIESALAQPQQQFSGEFLHRTLAEMAAAYLFHLVKNHGFIDGNKRTGAVAALVFLELNGVDTERFDEPAMEALTLQVAAGQAQKQDISEFVTRQIDRNH